MLNNRRKSQKNASNIIFIYIFAPEKQAKRVNTEIAVRRWRTYLRRVRNANVRLFLLTPKKESKF